MANLVPVRGTAEYAGKVEERREPIEIFDPCDRMPYPRLRVFPVRITIRISTMKNLNFCV